MPGLFGLVAVRREAWPAREAAAALLGAMAERLRHRPEFVVETWVDESLGVAVGRVAVPEVEASRHPAAADGPVTACLAGALLADGPAPSELASAYATAGDGLPLALRGFYAVVTADARDRRVTLYADRHASRPICYAEHRGLLLFAPEPKALLAVEELPRRPDAAAIALLLANGNPLCEQTLFESVRRLEGGHLLTVSDGAVAVRRYWQFDPSSEPSRAPEPELRAELVELVRRGVALNYESPEQTIIFLSAGLDSRAILGAALATVGGDGSRVHTATWGAVADRPDSDPVIAAQIAAAAGLQHRFFQRTVDDYARRFGELHYVLDGLSETALFHGIEPHFVAALREEGFICCFRGDQAFGSYGRPASVEGALVEALCARLRPMAGWRGVIRPAVHAAWCDAADAALEAMLRRMDAPDPVRLKDRLYYEQRLPASHGSAAYMKHLLMDHRNPLLHEDILDFARRVPAELRVGKRLHKAAVTAAYPALGAFPPATLWTLEDWPALLRAETPVRALIERELDDGASGVWEWLDPAALRRVLDEITAGAQIADARLLPRNPWRERLKETLLAVAPKLAAELRAGRRAKLIRPHYVLMRAIGLKRWYDVFIAGDGSRAANEARI